ncbi:MAG: PIN domain-containing protein [Pseudomonadota bacterium]
MKYLLDTCVISELVKPAPYRKVVDWLNEVPSDALFLSVITIGEIRKGLVKLPGATSSDSMLTPIESLI